MVPALSQKITVLLDAATQSAGATRSAFLDTMGSDYATISIPLGVEVNTNGIGPTIVLSETDATNAATSTWSTACTLSAHGLEAAHQVRFDVDTRARKRYLNLSIVSETTTNDHVTAAAVAVLSRRSEASPGTTGLAGSTNDTVVVL